MSQEIINELNELLSKAKLNGLLGLDNQTHKYIQEKIKHLDINERAKISILFDRFTGTCLYDAGGIFKARIYIDDQHTELTKYRPLAYVEISDDGYMSRVDVIDILESVRSNAITIGHPVILAAINHWQNLLIWEKYSRSDDKDSEDEIMQATNSWLTDEFLDSARANLEAIGKAMLEGSRRNAIPKEISLALKIEEINRKDTYLFVAWDRLQKVHIVDTEELPERIKKIEDFLRKLINDRGDNSSFLGGIFNNYDLKSEIIKEQKKYGVVNSIISIDNVIAFLEDTGSGYIYNEKSHNSARPKWTVFKNAFTGWYFKREVTTIRIYKNKAKEQKPNEKPYTPTRFGGFTQDGVYQSLERTLTSPLVKVCPTIECASFIVKNTPEFREMLGKRI